MAYLSGPRLAHNNSIATPVDYGISMAFSSDIIPLGPLVGVYAAVTHKGESGAIYGSEERVDVLEAWRMYTAGGAYFTFEEDKKG
jgi:predicted amidohydrolase YtcJ